ncbi:MAG: hypothetical protein K5878_09035 [Rhizobiaceae bacterium]|nr:hypothetical protein [Rhizobiaceae bacterium]
MRLAAIAALAFAAGCASGNVLEQAAIDRSIVTGTVATSSVTYPDEALRRDAEAMRDAAGAAELPLASPLSWSNVETGSDGVITDVFETSVNGRTCRRFMATRAAYDGVSVVSGEACPFSGGRWTLRSFE